MFLKFDARVNEKNFFSVFAVFLFTFLFFISISNISVARKYPKNTSFGYMVKLEEKPVLEVRAEKMDKLERLNEGWETQPPLWKWTFGLIITRFKEFLIDLEKSKEMDGQRKGLENVHERFSKELERYLKENKPPNWKKILESKEDFKTITNSVYLGVEKINITGIEKIPGVKKVHPAPVYHITLSDTIPSLKVPSVWKGVKPLARGYTGEGVKIAILDTGIDYTHPDLGSCTKGQFSNGNCGKVVGGYDFVNEDSDPMDNEGHGTHVAGIAAGEGDYNNNGEWDRGEIWGVAPDAEIYNYKVINQKGEGSTADMIKALSRSLDPDQDGDLSDRVDIISMSFGSRFLSDEENKIINRLVRNDVVVVAAAGNSGPGTFFPSCGDPDFGAKNRICSPAKSKKAIAVGAVNPNNEIAGFSSRGPTIVSGKYPGEIAKSYLKPNLVAPGVKICSAFPLTMELPVDEQDEYCFNRKHVSLSGTSMATPLVSGAVALLKEKHPEWSPGEIKHVLEETAKDLGYNNFKQGYGLLNVKRALERDRVKRIEKKIKHGGIIGKIKNFLIPGFKKVESPVNLKTSGETNGITEIKGKIKLKNIRKSKLQIKSNKEHSEWKTIAERSNPKKGTFRVKLDTRDFPDGFYILKLSIEDKNENRLSSSSVIEIANIKIYLEKYMSGPKNKERVFHNDHLRIYGTVKVKNFEKFDIKWSKIEEFLSGKTKVWEGPKSEGLKLTEGGNVKIDHGLLGTLDLEEVKHETKGWKPLHQLRIRLKVTKEDGSHIQETKAISLDENFPEIVSKKPLAEFRFSPKKPLVGQYVSFDASYSYVHDGEILEYRWDLDNDGLTEKEGRVIMHEFSNSRNIPVKLTVVDSKGRKDSMKRTVHVKSRKEADKEPRPQFTFSPKKPIAGQSVYFDASYSYDPDGKIKKYEWYVKKAGGEVISIGKGKEISHTFDESGKYEILLIVTDNSGNKDRISKQLNVKGGGTGSKGLDCEIPPNRNIYWNEKDCNRNSLMVGCNSENPDDYSYIREGKECVKMEPKIESYEIDPLSTDYSKEIKINSHCPEKLEGRCLAMCSLENPDNNKITIASWDRADPASIIYTCKKDGTYTINSCGYYTGFPENKGTGDTISVKKTFKCELPDIPNQIKAPIYFINDIYLYYLELENNKLRRAKDLFPEKLIGSSDIDQDSDQEIFYMNWDKKIEFWEDGKTKTTNIEVAEPVGSITNIGSKWLLPYTDKQGNMKIARFENSFKPEIVTTPINLNKENSLIGGIGDVDGDGNQEIIYTNANNNLVLANMDGKVEHSYNRKLYRGEGDRLSEIGDVDEDGKEEFFVRKGRNLYVYSEFQSKKLLEDIWDVGGIGDIDGDGRNELIFTDLRGRLKYLELTGSLYIKEIVDINVDTLGPGDIYNPPDETERMEKLHLAFHPTCGDGKEIAFQMGEQLEEELSRRIEEFKMRNKLNCKYKEDTNIPQEFPFWIDKSKENYLTISLKRSDNNRVYYIKGNEYGRKLAISITREINKYNPISINPPRGLRCPGYPTLCENSYGGSPTSVKIDFNPGNEEKIASLLKESILEYYKN